jgi:hypothetical protein
MERQGARTQRLTDVHVTGKTSLRLGVLLRCLPLNVQAKRRHGTIVRLSALLCALSMPESFLFFFGIFINCYLHKLCPMGV